MRAQDATDIDCPDCGARHKPFAPGDIQPIEVMGEAMLRAKREGADDLVARVNAGDAEAERILAQRYKPAAIRAIHHRREARG